METTPLFNDSHDLHFAQRVSQHPPLKLTIHPNHKKLKVHSEQSTFQPHFPVVMETAPPPPLSSIDRHKPHIRSARILQSHSPQTDIYSDHGELTFYTEPKYISCTK